MPPILAFHFETHIDHFAKKGAGLRREIVGPSPQPGAIQGREIAVERGLGDFIERRPRFVLASDRDFPGPKCLNSGCSKERSGSSIGRDRAR